MYYMIIMPKTTSKATVVDDFNVFMEKLHTIPVEESVGDLEPYT